MKNLVQILIVFNIGIVYSQCLSNDPYRLYWHRYVIEFDSSLISKNKIHKIHSINCEVKHSKFKKERKNFDVEFNKDYLPVKCIVYQEFNLRNGLKYNPIWRRNHDYPLYSVWYYELMYNQNNQLIRVSQKEKGAHATDTTVKNLDFEYDSLGRIVLQKEYKERKFNLTIKGKDSTYIYHRDMDSLRILYLTDSSGIYLNYKEHRRTDTIQWFNSPTKYALFNFGDTAEVFIRNIPIDRNTSMYYAIDQNSFIDRNESGLRIKKILNLGQLTKNEIVNLPTHSIIIYEYESKINTP